MDTHIDDRDLKLLQMDPYTFAVLRRILGRPCDLVLTDHERLILCHSAARYPVWLWTPDNLTGPDKARAWALAQAHRPLSLGYRYNLKYELAEDFLARAHAQGVPAGILTNLCAYDCPVAVRPAVPTDGMPIRCTMANLEEAAALRRAFYDAIGEPPPDGAQLLAKAAESIESGFFLWKTGAGETAACCGLKPDSEQLTSLGPVYTKPKYRRRHYAQHLVYHVTRLVAAMGQTPMLYTDADYPASNACYTGIGFIPRGRLCTIGLPQNQEPAHP